MSIESGSRPEEEKVETAPGEEPKAEEAVEEAAE